MKGASIDVNSDVVRNFIQKMRDKNITIDPTISVFESMFIDLPGKIAKAYVPVAAYLPPETKRNGMAGGFVDDESLALQYSRSYEVMKKFLKVLYDNGIYDPCGY
ncbi:MAG TPA: hypothetical protein VFZ33_11530 [Chitinophagaceae bacterium]